MNNFLRLAQPTHKHTQTKKYKNKKSYIKQIQYK